MKIAIGADHGGFELKQKLVEHLRAGGHDVRDLGTDSTGAVDYPVFARRVAEAVAAGQAERGIMIDGAGIGSAMVANKVPGVRAAMAYDVSSARNGREHNDANLLTLGAGLIGAGAGRPDRRRLPDHRLHRGPAPAPRGDDQRHRRRPAAAGAPPAAASDWRGDLSDTDLARVLQKLESLVGAAQVAGHRGGPVREAGTAAAGMADPAWAPVPTRRAGSSTGRAPLQRRPRQPRPHPRRTGPLHRPHHPEARRHARR